MNNNPLAKTIGRIFEKNIAETSYYFPNTEYGDEQKKQRVTGFVNAINTFLTKSGVPAVNTDHLAIDENKLIHFALQLSGYIRDAQKELHDLKDKYAVDADLIDLYRASAHYTVACSGKVKGNKYYFEESKDYCFWKVENPQNLNTSAYTNADGKTDPKRRCLIMSMPFHIKVSQEEIRKWTYLYMHDSLQNKNIFGSQVDVYLAHFPIEQPRGEKFSLSLQTIRNPKDFFAGVDMKFAIRNLSPFIGKDLRFDADNRIVGGSVYSPEEFKKNLSRLTIMGYCAGSHHAHRWLNALEQLSLQIYDRNTVNEAMKNIFFVSYASLPVQKENKYSGAHFISNFEHDRMQKEPFVKMFRPELYEQVKYTTGSGPARITTLPDRRNFIIAHKLVKELKIIDNLEKIITIPNPENGHHIGFITTPNLASEDNFPYYQFRTVLENAALGKRGVNVFDARNFHNYNQVLQNLAAISNRRSL